ncbi:hypothetical protein WOSG25_090170 [Weissella oryzae SG25]|uniref:Uncharacterized protein n=1 Tax=Weissella oryzae (strain DSM 25784 / JCM 18191 / LMG 30913 / SG25) TaxID=1329250 RepID=A0A069CU71_WEIOS|nr:hypothetical protein [Weissella oryzae]GAK31320.1 hypothetical protein WOSG25_090170 [Weissella oryzae SG25]
MKNNQVRTVTMTVENYNKILAVKEKADFEGIKKSKEELVRMFRANEFDRLSLSAVFDVYRNFDTAKFMKRSNNKVICKISVNTGQDMVEVRQQ